MKFRALRGALFSLLATLALVPAGAKQGGVDEAAFSKAYLDWQCSRPPVAVLPNPGFTGRGRAPANTELTLGISSTGQFVARRTSDSATLIFGSGSTSFTTVRVDGRDFDNDYNPFGVVVQAPTDTDSLSNVGIWDTTSGVRVTQSLRLVVSTTGRVDTVRIAYTMENRSGTSHQVGTRIMIDTMLGRHDDAPFRVPGTGAVTTEHEYLGEAIPSYFQVFDVLSNPTIVAQGTIQNEGAMPDRAVFCNWGRIVGTQWDYPIRSGSSNGDSAIALWWNPVALAPGEAITRVFYYGLGSVAVDTAGPLIAGIAAPSVLQVIDRRYQPNPFTVTLYLSNEADDVDGPVEGTTATLNLPPGFEFVNSTATQDIGTIARGASTQVSWVVRATGTASGDQSLSVQIDSTNEGSKSVSHTIQIPDLPRPTTQPDALIRLDSESDDQYGGVDVFQTTPSGAQVKTQTVGPNVTAGYKVRIVNASTESVTRAYVVKATTSAEAGWVVTYKVGNTDITAQATGSSGYATPSLAPGAGMVIAVDMRPGRAVVAGTTKSATVQAYMDNRLVDAVQAVTTVGSVSLVDLLAKLGTESEGAYALDDTYQPQAAGAQVRTHLIPSGGRATFQVKVQNDGNAADAQHFVIRAAQSAEAGWTVVYRVGSTDITSSITGTDGYQTPALQAGASMIITIEMTADAAVRGGTGKSTVLRASLEGSSQVLDCVQAVATVAAVTAPDLLIKQAGEPESAFGTNDTYQVAPGGGQIESQTVDAGGTATYDIRLENDDNTGTARTFVLKAVAGVEPGWQLVYRLGTTDITSSICDDRGYTTALLAPGQSLTLSLDVSPTAAAVGGNSKAAIVRVYLGGGDATVRDAVQATTRLNSAVQPDLLIKQGAEPEWLYSVNGSYQTTPSGEQVETQGVSPGGTAVYNVKLQNDGNVTRSFVVKALENTVTGWTVVYKTDGRDVTTLVKSAAGFTTTTLLPAGAVTFTIEVTAGDHAQGDTSKIVTLSALLGSNEVTPRDAVQAVTIADAVVQPDLLAKRNGEGDAALVGDDIYQASPATPQLLRQTVAAGQRATYWIRVQNDGNEPRAFTLRAVEAGAAGWTVSYKVGTAVVNAGITGTGGFRTPTIMPGSSLTVGVEMTPGTAAVVGATKSTAVAVLLDGADTTVRDVVQLDSSLAPADQPDLAIKPGAAADTAYVINNVYQSSPWGGQVLGQTAAAGAKVVYHIRLENDGARTRSFVLKTAESSGSGWSIVYKIGSTVVTPTIKGTSGYLVANLTAHSRVVLTVEVTPAANLAAAATKTVTVKASFAGETTVRDSVQAVTSVALREQPDLLIKDGRSTAAYAIDNTYYSVPGGAQLLRLTAVPGTPSRSWVRVQNDGNAARAFVLRGVDGTAAGWSIAYKVGATNVTASMKSAGGYTTAVLNPGAYLVVAVEMAPAVTVGVGARSSATVKAFLRATDATPRDCVMVYTTRGATPAP